MSHQSESETEETTPKRRRGAIRGKNKSYHLMKEYDSLEQAMEDVRKETFWSYKCTKKNKVYYRCNLAKARGRQCSKSLYIFKHEDNLKVSIYRTMCEHDHDGAQRESEASTTVNTTTENPNTIEELMMPETSRENLDTSTLDDSQDEEPAAQSQHNGVRGKNKSYHFVKEFKSIEQATVDIQKESFWSYKCKKGNKIFYRCNLAKAKGKQCSMSLYILLRDNSRKVSVYRTMCEHDHDGLRRVLRVSLEARNYIKELLAKDKHMKPQTILENLQKSNVKEVPTIRNVYNFLTSLRNKTYDC